MCLSLALLGAGGAGAAVTNTYYVVSGNLAAQAPFDAWTNAAADIQTAVNTASADLVPGTTECVVLVSNGTYTLTSQITITNGITLRSLSGRDATFINGNYPFTTNRCIEIRGSNTMVTVDGFTLTNGYAYLQPAGGGLYITNALATILNCTIAYNRAATVSSGVGNGAGLGVILGYGLLISNCFISANSCIADGLGIGVYTVSASGLIVDSQIANHTSSGNVNGGGCYMASGAGRLTFLRCAITNNYSGRYGGGAIFLGTATLDSCLVDGNVAASASGGLRIDSDSVIVTNCLISRNRAGGEGVGGVGNNRGYLYHCRIVGNYTSGDCGGISGERAIRNCLIAGNRADGRGGGAMRSATTTAANPMVNCTIVRNEAGNGGGGIYNLSTSAGLFNNVIVAHNEGVLDDSILGAKNGFTNSCAPDLVAGVNGNVTTDPQFVDPGSGFGTNAVLGDYHLLIGSPAIDTGSSNAPNRDLDGVLRPVDGDGDGGAACDMGAFEAVAATSGALRCSFTTPTTIALDTLSALFTARVAGTNTNNLAYFWTFGDGTTNTWPATSQVTHSYGYGSFMVTLSVSNEMGELATRSRPAFITVYPANVYVATNGAHVSPYGSWQTAASNLQEAVNTAVTGLGYTASVLVSNGVYTISNELTITRPVVVRGFSGNPVDTVIRGAFPATTNRCLNIGFWGALVDGVTITNGMAWSSTGGGINMTGASTIRNCVVAGNTAASTSAAIGGGIAATAGSILNCTVRNNSATASAGGGGIYVNGAGVIVSNCVISGNRATAAAGGGIRMDLGLVTGCTLSNNVAATYGGGLSKANTGAATNRNLLIVGNQAAMSGGGVYLYTGMALQNCTIAGNLGVTNGGVHVGATVVSAVNCIMAQNKATAIAGSNDIWGATANVSASCSPDLLSGVNGNLTTMPRFVKAGDGYGTNLVAGDYRLRMGSVGIDAGTNLAWMASAVDLLGDPRILGGSPNMGAYERPVAPLGATVQIH